MDAFLRRMYNIQPIGNSLPPLLTSGIHRPRSSDRLTVTVWDEAKKDIALIVIPIVATIPYGKDINSTIFDDDFIEEMQMISVEHGFWAKTMVNAHEQYAEDYDTA